MSSATSVNDALTGYAAGRLTAQQLVGVVVAAYYGAGGSGLGAGLKPVIEIIERAHPGIVELTSGADKPGFSVRLAERPFPKRFEGELREAVEILVGAQHAAPLQNPSPSVGPARVVPARGIFSRFFGAVRRLFTALT